MDNYIQKGLPFSKIDQIGVIVRDINKAVKHYQALGIGPFTTKNLVGRDRRVYGEPVDDLKVLTMFCQMGDVELELIQPVSGRTTWQAFLDKHGEGINHLGFFVADIEGETTKMVDRGYQVLQSGKFVGGGGYAYFDTDNIGGIIMELIQWPPL